MMVHSLRFVGLVLAGLTLVGCGGPGTIPAEGTLMVDGKPLEGVVVLFKPKTPEGKPASGTTDADGNFVLTTEINGDGAFPGEYSVGISKYESEGPELPTDVDPNDPNSMDAVYEALDKQGRGSKSKSVIAKRFNSPDTSGISATVSDNAEENKFSFEASAK